MKPLLIAVVICLSLLSFTISHDAFADGKIPSWVKNIFVWYGEGKTSENDLLGAIKFLVEQGIIQIDTKSFVQSSNTIPTPLSNSNSAPKNPTNIIPPVTSYPPQSSNDNIITNSNFLKVQNNPDNYVNQWAKLEGTFSQDPYIDKNGLTWVDFNYAQGDTMDANKEVWFTYTNSNLNIKSTDCAIAEGHILGSSTLQYKLTGATDQVPEINLEKITDISCLDARYPAINTINVGQSQTQGNIKVTIDKIAISQYNTRIFAKVENLGDQKGISFYGGTIVQGQNQYNSNYGPFGISENNLNFVTGIQSGVVEQGVLFFNTIENQPFKLMLKGTEESSYNEDDFVFNITP
jgi:hypothetical protein